MPEKPQINIKLLSENERSLVERGKKRAEDLRLTFKDFLLNCLKQALVEYDASNEPATKGDILALNDKIAVLEDKVNHPAIGRGELLAVHDRLNQLRSEILNEIRKDREQVAALKEAISRLEECVSQLMPDMELLVDIHKQLASYPLEVAFNLEGQVLGILGGSGSGKSMTLRCIAGLETPNRGRIVVNGRVLFDSLQRIITY